MRPAGAGGAPRTTDAAAIPTDAGVLHGDAGRSVLARGEYGWRATAAEKTWQGPRESLRAALGGTVEDSLWIQLEEFGLDRRSDGVRRPAPVGDHLREAAAPLVDDSGPGGEAHANAFERALM